jgi:hypothetical protein
MLSVTSGAVILIIVVAALSAVMLLMWNPETGYTSRDTTWP